MTKTAEAAEVSVRCARKWVGRYRTDGELGLLDRSSVPNAIPHRTSEERVQAIAALRRLRFTGPEIAETLGMALSTVSGILTRIGMGKLGRLGLEPAQRYERESAASARPTGRRSPSAKFRSARRLRRNILPWSVERWLVHLAAWQGGTRRCYGRRREAVGRVST